MKSITGFSLEEAVEILSGEKYRIIEIEILKRTNPKFLKELTEKKVVRCKEISEKTIRITLMYF